MSYFLREKILPYYNEDHYFDTLGVLEDEETQSMLMERLQDAIVRVHNCSNDRKPTEVMACIHLANSLVRQYRLTERFRTVLVEKMETLMREETLSPRDRSLIEDYLTTVY